MEKRNDILVAVILIISIIGQIVSYVAVDQILERCLGNTQQIVVTVSDNSVESVAEMGQIPRVDVKVEDYATKPKGDGFEPNFEASQNVEITEGVLTPAKGVNYYNGCRETFYNLPMDLVVTYARQRIEGMEEAEYTIDENGCKCLGGYIMVATNYDVHPYGERFSCSLGECIAVDTGSFALYSPNQIDIATNW
jgi:hypothetical protein